MCLLLCLCYLYFLFLIFRCRRMAYPDQQTNSIVLCFGLPQWSQRGETMLACSPLWRPWGEPGTLCECRDAKVAFRFRELPPNGPNVTPQSSRKNRQKDGEPGTFCVCLGGVCVFCIYLFFLLFIVLLFVLFCCVDVFVVCLLWFLVCLCCFVVCVCVCFCCCVLL